MNTLLLTLCLVSADPRPSYDADATAALALAKAARERTTPKTPVVTPKPAPPKTAPVSGPAWTWPGMTESSLRVHLAGTHGYTSQQVAAMSFEQLKASHNASHNGVAEPAPVVSVPVFTGGGCPGGNCPNTYSAPSRGLFGGRR